MPAASGQPPSPWTDGTCDILLRTIKQRQFLHLQSFLDSLNLTSQEARRFPCDVTDPVSIAAELGDDAIFNLLLQTGFDPNRKAVSNSSVRLRPLHVLACRGDCLLAKILIDKYFVPIDTRDSTGKTPLMWALYRNCKNMVEFLILRGADVNVVDFKGVSAISVCISKRHDISMMKQLLASGCNVTGSEKNRSLLYKAGCLGQMDFVKELYKHGAPLTDEVTALWGSRYLAVVKFLVEINAPLHPSNESILYRGLCESHLTERAVEWLDIVLEAGITFTNYEMCFVKRQLSKGQGQAFWVNTLRVKLNNHIFNIPRSLSHLCCLFVRKHVGPRLPKVIHDFPVPLSMKKYLLLEHVYT